MKKKNKGFVGLFTRALEAVPLEFARRKEVVEEGKLNAYRKKRKQDKNARKRIRKLR